MRTETHYVATSLEDIAAHMDGLAEAAEALSARTPGKARSLAQSQRANAYRDAAGIIRRTILEPTK